MKPCEKSGTMKSRGNDHVHEWTVNLPEVEHGGEPT